MKSSISAANQKCFRKHASMKKGLLENPEEVIAHLKEHSEKESDLLYLDELATKLTSCSDQQATLIVSRKEKSALIGKAKKNGDDIKELLRRSRELSYQLNEINNQIENLIDNLLELCSNSSSEFTPDINDSSVENQDSCSVTGPGQFLPVPSASSAVSSVHLISKTTHARRWNEYVAGNIHATHYHQYQWREIIERNFAKKSWYFIAENEHGEIIGVAASVHMNSRIFGSFMLSMPFLIYGGPVADNTDISHGLATRISEVAEKYHCTHTQLRETHERKGWHSTLEKVSMVLELPESLSALDAHLGSKLRAQIKRAIAEKPEFQLGNSELIPEFYAVFSRKMRDHGTPVYAKKFFLDMAHTFPQTTHVAVVRLKGKPVAAAFLISFRDTIEIPWAASIREYDRLGMNMFMYHALLDHAVRQEFKYFDFGRSTRGESTYKFKKQWGAQERQLHWNYLSGNRPHDPGSGGSGSKFSLAVRLWKKLPLWIANRAGPLIARQLPW